VTVADPAASAPDAPPAAEVDAAAGAGPDETGPALLHGCATSEAQGQRVVHPNREQYLDLLRHLLDDGYDQCLDVFGVDYLVHPGRSTLPDGVAPERFEVVLLLINHGERTRLRVRVQVPEDDPTLPSLFTLWPGTEAPERETFDMFGIEFTGHPDLTRILMPEDWVGHPLRKDYSVGAIPVQFSEDHTAPPPAGAR
jgi:NADH-quinone oxidoreductase subunit C